MKSVRGFFFILGATTLWGVSATVAKFLFTEQVDVLVLVQLRMTISLIVFGGILAVIRPGLLRIHANDLPGMALMGIIGGAGSNFTYYYAIQQTNVATAILLQYMAPLLVLAYAAISKAERVTMAKIAAGIVSLAGCFLAVGETGGKLSSMSTSGLIAGLASAFCWGFANIWLRRLLNRYAAWTTVFYTFLFASLFWMFVNPPWKLVTAGYSAGLWGTFFIFAMISILIPHSLYFLGVRHLTASRAIITATSEPILAIVSAYLILGETLSPVQIIGSALVIAAIAALQIRREEEPHETVSLPIPPVE